MGITYGDHLIDTGYHDNSSGWKGAAIIPDPAVPGLVPFLEKALRDFDVQIFSSRSNQAFGIVAMKEWLSVEVAMHFDVAFAGDPKDAARADAICNAIKWPKEKPAAMVTIDDRAITFTGKWPDVQTLKEFQPWNKKPSPSSTPAASRSANPIRAIRMAWTSMLQRVRA